MSSSNDKRQAASANGTANVNSGSQSHSAPRLNAVSSNGIPNVNLNVFQTPLLSAFGSLLNPAGSSQQTPTTPSPTTNPNPAATAAALLSPSAYAQFMADPLLLALATASLQQQQQQQQQQNARQPSSPFSSPSPSASSVNPFAALMAGPFGALPPFLGGASAASTLPLALTARSNAAANVGAPASSPQLQSPQSAPASASTGANGLDFFKQLAEQTRVLNALRTASTNGALGKLQTAQSPTQSQPAAPTTPTAPASLPNAASLLSLAASLGSASSASTSGNAQLQAALSAFTSALQTLTAQPSASNRSDPPSNAAPASSLNLNGISAQSSTSDSKSHVRTPSSSSSAPKAHLQSKTSLVSSSSSKPTDLSVQSASSVAQKRVTDFSIHSIVNDAKAKSSDQEPSNSVPNSKSSERETKNAAAVSDKKSPAASAGTTQPSTTTKAATQSRPKLTIPNREATDKSVATKQRPKQKQTQSTTPNSKEQRSPTSAAAKPRTQSASAERPSAMSNGNANGNVPAAYQKPIDMGWRRETRLKPSPANNTVFGEVTYLPPSSASANRKRISNLRDLTRFLQHAKDSRLTKHNFCFNPKTIFGAYLIWSEETKTYREMTHNDLQKLCEMVDHRQQQSTSNQSKAGAKANAAAQTKKPRPSGNATKANAEKSANSARSPNRIAQATATPEEQQAGASANATAKAPDASESHPPRPSKRSLKKKAKALAQANAAETADANDSSAQIVSAANLDAIIMTVAAASPDRTDTPQAQEDVPEPLAKPYGHNSRRSHRTPNSQSSFLQSAWNREVQRAFDDLQLTDSKDLPELERVPGNRLNGVLFAECLEVVEFLHTFGSSLGFDRPTLPTMHIFQRAYCDADDSCKLYISHLACALFKVAMNDPVLSHVKQFPTSGGDLLGDIEVRDDTLPKLLRVFMAYMLARDTQLKDTIKKAKRFSALTPEAQCKCLTFMSHELLGGRFVSNEIDRIIEQQTRVRKEKWAIDTQLRRARIVMNQKFGATSRTSAAAPTTLDQPTAAVPTGTDQPAEDSLKPAATDATAEKQEKAVLETDAKNGSNSEVENQQPDADGSDKHGDALVNELIAFEEADDRRSRLRRTPARSAKLAEENVTPLIEPKTDTPAPTAETAVSKDKEKEKKKENEKVNEDNDSDLGTNFLLTLSATEDEFAQLDREELEQRITKLETKEKQKQNQTMFLQRSLRGLHLGNDRFHRNFWVLPTAGGVYVEAIESADFDADEHVRKLASSSLNDSTSASSSDEDSDTESNAPLSNRSKSKNSSRSKHGATSSTASPKPVDNAHDGAACLDKSEAESTTVKTENRRSEVEQQPLNIKKEVKTELESEENKKGSGDVAKSELSTVKDDATVSCLGADAQSSDTKAVEGTQQPESKIEQPVNSSTSCPVEADQEKSAAENRAIMMSKIPDSLRSGWWRIAEPDQVRALCRNLNTYGVREKILHRNVTRFFDNVVRGTEILQSTSVFAYDATHLPSRPRVRAKVRGAKKNKNKSNGGTTSGNTSRHNESAADKANEARSSKTGGESEKASKSRTESDRSKAKNSARRSSQPECTSSSKRRKTAAVKRKSGGLDDVLSSITQNVAHADAESESEGSESAANSVCRSASQSDDTRRSSVNASGTSRSRSRSPLLSDRANARTFSRTLQVIREIEQLEERVVSASLQSKGWTQPSSVPTHDRIRRIRKDFQQAVTKASSARQAQAIDQLIELARRRLLSLEAHVEQRYLKAPFTNAGQLRKTIRRAIRRGVERSRQVTPRCMRKPRKTNQNDADQRSASDSSSECAWSCNSTRAPSPCGSSARLARLNCHESATDLQAWRTQVQEAFSVEELRSCLRNLDGAIEWEKSIMKVLCAICRMDNNEGELLLCDGCDKGYHTYCFKPAMQTVPQGEFYCWHCVAHATGRPRCFICGSRETNGSERLLTCVTCSHWAHSSCIAQSIPTSNSNNSGQSAQWACPVCTNGMIDPISKNSDKLSKRRRENNQALKAGNAKRARKPSTPSASSSEDDEAEEEEEEEEGEENEENGENDSNSEEGGVDADDDDKKDSSDEERDEEDDEDGSEDDSDEDSSNDGSDDDDEDEDDEQASVTDASTEKSKKDKEKEKEKDKKQKTSRGAENRQSKPKSAATDVSKRSRKAEPISNGANRKEQRNGQQKRKAREPAAQNDRRRVSNGADMSICTSMIEELKKHEKSWPFQRRVNTKQFPMYRRIIKRPIDIGTISSKLRSNEYATHKEFVADIRLMFDNCETFNEDDSEIGRAGHLLRIFFESRWSQLCQQAGLEKSRVNENGSTRSSVVAMD